MSTHEKRRVVRWHNRGKTIGQISIEFDRSRPTIIKLLSLYEAGGKKLLATKRKQKLSGVDRARIVTAIQQNPDVRAKSIRETLDLKHVHVDTICRFLYKKGYITSWRR